MTLPDIAYVTCRGGWPDTISMNHDVALDQAFDYVDAVAEIDISEADHIRRDPEQTRRLLRSYARNQGTQTPLTTLRDDMKANESVTFSEDTVSSYLEALHKIYVIEDMRAWNPNLRSKTAIRTSDNRYFIDPSIATAVLGLGPSDLINDLNTFGLIFETLCVRDLRVFADALDGNVYHYRDKDRLECDAVVHLRNGSYGLVEIKLGGDALIEEGVKSLLTLANKIDTTKMKNPSFLMVLTAVGKYAFRRADGVYVVPIGCLKD
jgi:predicted AAA+ superfamily ATPase